MAQELLRIGQLAQRCGVSADTIRYYERIGVAPRPARTPSGYRQYPDSAVDRLRLIRNALRFGFSLKQIAIFLRARHSGSPPCKQVRAAATQIMEAVDREIAQLTASRESIRRTLDSWDRRLSQTPEGCPAHLLETLPQVEHAARPPTARRTV